MATSTTISLAETWEKVYQAYNQVNFTAFDYYSIKSAIVEYMKVYFPDSFNDFIESSEFVMLVEIFAYLSEQLIYRVDLNSHENFISVAQRKQSVLRLAKLISYNATRNIPARGLVKLTSVQTTEQIYDSRGTSLKGVKILWNDVNNSLWREQFIGVLNAASSTSYGTVAPNDRVQVDNVLYELYSLNNRYTTNGVFPYSATSNGTSYSMELVSSTLTSTGPVESRPDYNSSFNYLYSTDGLGDDSPNTGFFISTKQGSLTTQRTTFDGKTPNQTYDITTTNINDTDVWLNNVDSTTDAILDDSTSTTAKSGAWTEVDTTTAENVIYSSGTTRNRYEIETLENDEIRLIFGDGLFADIPNGTFDIWYRTSANADITITQNSVSDTQFSVSYTDDLGANQTLQFTASLIANLQNASASEDIDHIRSNAPGVYYTQNRLVNGADYNVGFAKDPTILKVQTINRTYIGDSKYSYWYDASSTYENVKIFGDDLCILFEDVIDSSTVAGTVSVAALFTNYIVPILSTVDMYNYMVVSKVADIRKAFTAAETTQIMQVLTYNSWPDPVYLYYRPTSDLWKASTILDGTPYVTITATMSASQVYQWTVTNIGYAMHVQSPSTKFWDANDVSLISYETLSPARDEIIILKANLDRFGLTVIADNLTLLVDGIVTDSTTGLPDITKLSVTAYDAADTNLVGSDLVVSLMDPYYSFTPQTIVPYTITLPFTYVTGVNELTVTGILATFWEEDPTVAIGATSSSIVITGIVTGPIIVYRNDFVYYTRVDASSPWTQVDTSITVAQNYAAEQLGNTTSAEQLYNRIRGKSGINFLWTHQAPDYGLVNPSMTNINDVFIIQKGYYNDFISWINDTGNEPTPPTSLQLTSDYSALLETSMISDTVILHSGKLKLIFGSKSDPDLQAKLVVVKSTKSTLTDSQIRITVSTIVQNYFNISNWEFGQTFYFTELAAAIHKQMPSDISTVVLVPLDSTEYFGDMFEVNINEDEIIQADIGISDIDVVTSLNPVNINQVR